MPNRGGITPLYVVKTVRRASGAVECQVVDISDRPHRIMAACTTRKAAEVWIANAERKRRTERAG